MDIERVQLFSRLHSEGMMLYIVFMIQVFLHSVYFCYLSNSYHLLEKTFCHIL